MQKPETVVPYELVTLELGGRTRQLFASFYAIKRIRELTRVDLRDPATYTEWHTDHLPIMLHELLQHEAEPPSIEEIERTFDLRRAEEIAGKIFECVGIDIHALADLVEEASAAAEAGEDPLEFARRMKRKGRNRNPGRRRSS